MRQRKNTMCLATLRTLIHYDPETGSLTWKPRNPEDVAIPRGTPSTERRAVMALVWNTRWAGTPAFRARRGGYGLSRIKGVYLSAHRAAWAMHCGAWPPDEMEIDHINGDRNDNRIANLRVVTRAENAKNKRLQKTNKSGCSGVLWVESRQRWEVSISNNGRTIHVGSYDHRHEAILVRKAVEKVLGYSEGHGSVDRPFYSDPLAPNRTRKTQP